jgi:signal transduction histidine kinase
LHERNEKYLKVAVEDNGHGISDSDQKKIF